MFAKVILLSLLSLCCATQLIYNQLTIHPDFNLTITEFLDKYSYEHETHFVETEDGYILGLHRITSRRNKDADPKGDKPVVLLVHGLGSSSMDYVNLGPNKSIALMLADEGYDVWLGNCRGNTWSRNHKTLNASVDKEFWDYSFHEMGVYDLPAKIDYILKETGKEQLSYIGHSQGTTTFFIMASTKPEYNDKVNVMAALAPIAYMSKIPNPVAKVLSQPVIQLLAALVIYTLKMYEILPHTNLFTMIGENLCCDGCDLQDLCADVLYLVGGYGPDQLDKSFIPVIFSNAPAGASYKVLGHYLQEIRSGSFRPFDYGVTENRNRYKESTTPPSYTVENIKAPVYLFYSKNDAMAAIEDVETLADQLPNASKKLISYDNFTHLDFLWAIDIVEYLNQDLVTVIKDYNDNPVVTTTIAPESTTQGSGALVSSMKMIVLVVIGGCFVNMLM